MAGRGVRKFENNNKYFFFFFKKRGFSINLNCSGLVYLCFELNLGQLKQVIFYRGVQQQEKLCAQYFRSNVRTRIKIIIDAE